MEISNEFLINKLISNPSSERETGYNMAIIEILQGYDAENDSWVRAFRTKNLNVGTYMTKSQYKRVNDHLKEGHKLAGVKELKDITGLGLKEAKDVLDAYCTFENIQ